MDTSIKVIYITLISKIKIRDAIEYICREIRCARENDFELWEYEEIIEAYYVE